MDPAGALDPGEAFDAERWSEFLAQRLGHPVTVRFGRARTTVLRVVRRHGASTVTMSSFFERAPAEVREGVLGWLRAGKRDRVALDRLDRWVDDELRRLSRDAPRRASLRSTGEHHDLERIALPLWTSTFASAFADDLRPALTYGRRGPSRGRGSRRPRTLRLGSYDAHLNLVRIHPALDQPFVPDWFVRYIVFHELLHAELGIERERGRRVIHGAEFRRRERAYPDYVRAIAWEKANLRRLLGLVREPSRSMRVTLAARAIQRLLF